VCFLDKAAASNQFELQSSQLALQKSSSAAVKKVAQMIIKDHQAAGASLKALAAQYGAAPSTALNTQQQALLNTLKGQSGKVFDVTYLTQQVSAHNEAINLFRSYSQPSGSPDQNVRQFAAKTLPGLTMHGQMIQSAQKSVAGSGAQSGSTGAQPTKPTTGSK
jgi:putative membrane protein